MSEEAWTGFCGMCKRLCRTTSSGSSTMKEYKKLYPDYPEEEAEMLCNDCAVKFKDQLDEWTKDNPVHKPSTKKRRRSNGKCKHCGTRSPVSFTAGDDFGVVHQVEWIIQSDDGEITEPIVDKAGNPVMAFKAFKDQDVERGRKDLVCQDCIDRELGQDWKHADA